MRSMIVWGITCWNVLCALDVHIETPHAIVMNAETGAILYEKRAHASVYPASTTKIATVLYALQQGREGEVAEASREALRVVTESIKTEKGDLLPPYILETDGTTAHLRPGQKKTLVELMDDAIDLSANDSANVLAEYLEGDILVFTWRLNEMAKALGCKQTHFVNPHGLFHPDHTTTAYDMAMIMKAALHYPLFRTLIKEAVIVRKYPFAVGGKTGYTRRAKYNIVAVAKKGEREIIAALHASPTSEQRYKDCIALFEAVFAEEKKERLLFSQEETVFEGLGVLGEDVYLSYYPSEEEDVEARVVWTKRKRPILQGEEIGRLEILAKKGGRVIQTAPLFSRETLDASHWMRNTMVAIVLLLGVWQIGRGIRQVLTSRGEDQLDRDR